MIQVKLPPGSQPGQQMQFPVPPGSPDAGVLLSFIVPQGAQPGQIIQVPMLQQNPPQTQQSNALGQIIQVPMLQQNLSQTQQTNQQNPPQMQQTNTLDDLCALNHLFHAEQRGVQAAVPSDLAAGWIIYSENFYEDLLFYALHSSPLLDLVFSHHNNPTSSLRRFLLESIMVMVTFYLVLYYMMLPLTGWYGENDGAVISSAVFTAVIRTIYSYLAQVPCVQGDDHSEQDRAEVEKCTRWFLCWLFFFNLAILLTFAGELGKFANSDANYCRVNKTDGLGGGVNATGGVNPNPNYRPDLQWNCPLQNPTVAFFKSWVLQILIELLKSPVMFKLKRKGAYKRVKSKMASLRSQQPAGTASTTSSTLSFVDPLNVLLASHSFVEFTSETRHIGLQFLAVARRRGQPFACCISTYGSVVHDSKDVTEEVAVAEYKMFLKTVSGLSNEELTTITMKHVCAWCGWQIAGNRRPDLDSSDLELGVSALAGAATGAAVGTATGIGISQAEAKVVSGTEDLVSRFIV